MSDSSRDDSRRDACEEIQEDEPGRLGPPQPPSAERRGARDKNTSTQISDALDYKLTGLSP